MVWAKNLVWIVRWQRTSQCSMTSWVIMVCWVVQRLQKNTGMSDEDQSKFWSQVQKAEGAKVKRIKAKDEPTDLDEKAHVETVVEKVKAMIPKDVQRVCRGSHFPCLTYRRGHERSDGALRFLTQRMVGEGLWCLEQSSAPVSQRTAQVLWREYDRLIANAEQALQKHRADHEEKVSEGWNHEVGFIA